MFAYELRLALLSFRKNPILTSLMVAAIALGIGVCMTTVTMFYLMSGNPIPHKSDQLYAVQLDNWDPNSGYNEDSSALDDNPLPEQVTWIDANALLERAPDYPQAAMFKAQMVVETGAAEQAPLRKLSRLTTRDFFTLFDVPFQYGSAWESAMEARADAVVVISSDLNEELFGGENSVGQSLRIDDSTFRIVGVLAPWQPAPKFYDLNNGSFHDSEDLYLPLTLAVPMEIQTSGNTSCWKSPEGEGYSALLNSECVWLQYWVQLNNADEYADYENFLTAYFKEQQELGRYQRPLNVGLSDVQEWLDRNEVVSNDSQVLVGLAFMFLAVCVFNTVGLLLTKFLGRSKETSIRRALGATRRMIFRQHLVEVGSIGLVGGLLGLLLAWLGLGAVDHVADAPDALVQLNTDMMLIAILLAVGATLVAGIYPSWHIGRMTPARYLRT